MASRPRILCLSFSELISDARVLRQLSVISEFGDVTTVGYGPATMYSREHYEIPKQAKSLPETIPGVFKLALRMHDSVDMDAPATQETLKLLKGKKFDCAVVNEIRALPAGLTVADSCPLWIDLHEWAPEENTQLFIWKVLISPWFDHLCKKWLPKADLSTTVGSEIVNLYSEHYGVTPRLMRNAAKFVDLEPTPVKENGPIRLVHSGMAVAARGLDKMVEAIKQLNNFTLDLYLVPAGDGGKFLSKLEKQAEDCDRITFHDPVKPADLPKTLNQYDVGAYWIPPYSTNARLALPNKFFDFVQARLALALGPTVEMAKLVNEYDLGVIADGFDVPDIVNSLKTLTPENVWQAKQASHKAASKLSFENEAETARNIMRELLKL